MVAAPIEELLRPPGGEYQRVSSQEEAHEVPSRERPTSRATPSTSRKSSREVSCTATNEDEEEEEEDDEDDMSLRNDKLRQQRNARLAGAKLLNILLRQERGQLAVEKTSVYGAALAVPQLARSCEWPAEMVSLSVRTYFFLALNIFLQVYLIFLINKEELVMDKFAGQMYLCNMGAHMENCPDGPGCAGPSGTRYTAARLYDYSTWATRVFIRESLVQLFPDKREEIMSKVDPGEYGVENSECRLVCCFLFVMSLMSELQGIQDFAKLLIYIPTKAESWVRYEVPDWASKDHVKKVLGLSELDLVSVQIAGMPLHWKVINGLFVLLPKVFLWAFTLLAGSTFLMETSSIDNIIVNATALGFVLSIDELIFASLTTSMTRQMLEKLEGYALFDSAEEQTMSDRDVLVRYKELHKRSVGNIVRNLASFLPLPLLIALCLWLGGLLNYYLSNCEMSWEGTWVSKSMYTPKSMDLTLGQGFMPQLFSIPSEETPFWTFPKEPA